MATPRLTEEEITARARQLADEHGPGWETVAGEEQVGKDTVELRYWREVALKDLRPRCRRSWRLRPPRPRRWGSINLVDLAK
jgi:hypothetical protein